MANNNSQIPGTLISNPPTNQPNSNIPTAQPTNNAPIPPVNFNEQRARRALRSQLEESIRSFIATYPVQNLSPANATLVTWVADRGKEAQEHLTYFWDHLTEYGYKYEIMEYIDIYQQVGGNVALDSVPKHSTIHSLEHFCHAKSENNNDENVLYVCSKRDKIFQPRVSVFRTSRIFNKSAPTSTMICTSAVIAFLFLVQSDLNFSVSDMYNLLVGFLSHDGSEYIPDLPNIPAKNLEIHALSSSRPASIRPTPTYQTPLVSKSSVFDDTVSWHSTNASSIMPSVLDANVSTIILHFPGVLPTFKTNSQYMEIWEPHKSRPESDSRCTIWGSQRAGRASWASVVICLNCKMASTLRDGLSTLCRDHPSEFHHHWANIMRYIYLLGINNARLHLRDTMRNIDNLKYENTARPSTGYANVCQMALNHFEYHQRQVKSLLSGLRSFPAAWSLTPLPTWANDDGDVAIACKILDGEINQACTRAKDSLLMVIQQHTLQQSWKATVLTVILSIFIPASFVTSFFGMNTSDLGQAGPDSSSFSGNITFPNSTSPLSTGNIVITSDVENPWPVITLRRFFAITIPLIFLTVVLPLIFLPVFKFMAWITVSSQLRSWLFWTWFVCSFILNALYDFHIVLDRPDHHRLTIGGLGLTWRSYLLFTAYFGAIPLLPMIYLAICRNGFNKLALKMFSEWRKHKLAIVFSVFVISVGIFHIYFPLATPFIEEIPYVLYVIYRAMKWVYKQKAHGDKKSWWLKRHLNVA